MESSEKKFQSPEYKQVTERTYDQYLEFFSLLEENLKGKTILDIGSGFGDFVETANKRFGAGGTKAVGVDPVYAFFNDDFEKFKDSLEGSRLFLEFSYGKKSALGMGSLEEWRKAQKDFYDDFYQKVKSSKTYIAGSHQALPFRNESIDLIVGSNSVVCFKDRKVVQKALKELLRVVKKDGEIRLMPIALSWDDAEKTAYLMKVGEMTDADIDILERTGKFPDKAFMQILKELELVGVKFYSVVSRATPEDQEFGGQFYLGNIILRQDEQLPEVDENAADFCELRKLHFIKSSDDFYIPSEILKTKSTPA